MPATTTIPIPPPPGSRSRAVEQMVRTALAFPFTDPLLDQTSNGWSRLSQLSPGQRRLLSFLDSSVREQGVTVFGLRHACRVMGLAAEDVIALLDELNRAKIIFFVSFEIPEGAKRTETMDDAWVFYACKPMRQSGDTPLKVAHRLALRLIREGRA